MDFQYSRPNRKCPACGHEMPDLPGYKHAHGILIVEKQCPHCGALSAEALVFQRHFVSEKDKLTPVEISYAGDEFDRSGGDGRIYLASHLPDRSVDAFAAAQGEASQEDVETPAGCKEALGYVRYKVERCPRCSGKMILDFNRPTWVGQMCFIGFGCPTCGTTGHALFACHSGEIICTDRARGVTLCLSGEQYLSPPYLQKRCRLHIEFFDAMTRVFESSNGVHLHLVVRCDCLEKGRVRTPAFGQGAPFLEAPGLVNVAWTDEFGNQVAEDDGMLERFFDWIDSACIHGSGVISHLIVRDASYLLDNIRKTDRGLWAFAMSFLKASEPGLRTVDIEKLKWLAAGIEKLEDAAGWIPALREMRKAIDLTAVGGRVLYAYWQNN